jgi:hypothetical protein
MPKDLGASDTVSETRQYRLGPAPLKLGHRLSTNVGLATSAPR